MPSFQVGDFVKCIDCNGTASRIFDKDAIYEIEHVEEDGKFVLIVGVNFPGFNSSGQRWLWTANRFVHAPSFRFSEYLDAITGGKDA